MLVLSVLSICSSDESKKPSSAVTNPVENDENYDAPQSEFKGGSLGKFTTQDINGNTYINEMLSEYDLQYLGANTTWY